jgi:hypothetical protein
MRERAKAYRDTPEGKAALAAYHKTPERQAKRRELAKRRAKRPEAAAYRKAFRLKSHFGLTVEAYRQMIADQKNRCAVCGDEMKPGSGTCVDHDHVTGQVRGLLCPCCNVAEGMLKGSILRCQKMIAYLKRNAPKLRLVQS